MDVNDMEVIEEYNLNADPEVTDHDLACIQQAAKLQSIGYLEHEAAMYACAVQSDDVYYFVTEKEESAVKFVKQCLLEGLYPTPIHYFVKRFDLIDKTAAEITNQYKLSVAKSLQETYPKEYFGAINDLTSVPSYNAAYPIVFEIEEQLENLFDMDQLIMFDDLLDTLLKARQLNLEGYHLARSWLRSEKEKFSQDYMASSPYKRTYAGFAYLDQNGKCRLFCDAVLYNATNKREKLMCEDMLTTPILQKTYYADSFQALLNTKDQFLNEFHSLDLNSYFKLMRLFRELPASVDKEKYNEYNMKLQQICTKSTMNTYNELGRIWNVHR